MNTKPRSESNAPGAKFYFAILAAVVTYLLAQEVLDWPKWLEVLLNAASVAIAVYLGIPQRTIPSGTVGSFALIPVAAAVFATVGGLVWILLLVLLIILIVGAVGRSRW